MQDATTFLLCFLALFGGLAALLLHLQRRAKALEDRLATLEAATAPGTAGTAKPKGGGAEPGAKA